MSGQLAIKAPLPLSQYAVREVEAYTVHEPGDKLGVWVVVIEGRPDCIQHGKGPCPHIEAVMPKHLERAAAKAPQAPARRGR